MFEHVLPAGILIRRLLTDVPATTAALRAALEASPERVIISKEEDDALTHPGMRNAGPTRTLHGAAAARAESTPPPSRR